MGNERCGRIDRRSGSACSEARPLQKEGGMKARLIIAALLTATLAACSPPPILGHIQCDDLRDCRAASREFTVVVQRRFPIGSSQSALEAELLRQGFHRITPQIARCSLPGESKEIGKSYIDCPPWDSNWNPRNYLAYDLTLLSVCGHNIVVLWSSDAKGKITHIEGHYDVTCL